MKTPKDPLQEMLQTASLHSLLMLTSKALSRSGFGDVEILDRRSSKQKTRFGGYEMACRAQVGTLPMKIIVKVIRDGVRLRMLSELAGSVLQANADMGIIMSPFNRSESLPEVQAAFKPVRLEIIDGTALAALIRSTGIGMRPKGTVDFAFFSELEDASERILAFMKGAA